jgi:hypothetical protein
MVGDVPKPAGGCSAFMGVLFWLLVAIGAAVHLVFSWLWWAVPLAFVAGVPLGFAVWRWVNAGRAGAAAGGIPERRDERSDLIGPDPEDRMTIVSIAVWGWWAVSFIAGMVMVVWSGGDPQSHVEDRLDRVPPVSLILLAVLVMRSAMAWKELQAVRAGILPGKAAGGAASAASGSADREPPADTRL